MVIISKTSPWYIILVSLALISVFVYIVVALYLKAPGSVLFATLNAYTNTTNSTNFNMTTGLRVGSNPDAIAANSKTDFTAKFSVTKYGTLNANFINSVPISIPQEYLVGLYGVILGFIIPSIAMWFNGKRQRGYLKTYIEKIEDIYGQFHHAHTPDEYLKRLDVIEKEITVIYTKGKLSDSHYNVLKHKVSEYKQSTK